jgi:hypothetical protein
MISSSTKFTTHLARLGLSSNCLFDRSNGNSQYNEIVWEYNERTVIGPMGNETARIVHYYLGQGNVHCDELQFS